MWRLIFIQLILSVFHVQAKEEQLSKQRYYEIRDFLYEAGELPEVEWDPDESSSIGKGTESTLKSIIKLLPEDSALSDGLLHYLDIINAKSYANDREIGRSNKGITIYNQRSVFDNPCFAKAAEHFIEEVKEIDQIQYGEDLDESDLTHESGKGRYKDLRPGWLFDLAKKYTNDNANIAMKMIITCGHDDVVQGTMDYIDRSSNNNFLSKEEFVNFIDMEIAHNIRRRNNDLYEADGSERVFEPGQYDNLIKPFNVVIQKLNDLKHAVQNSQLNLDRLLKKGH